MKHIKVYENFEADLGDLESLSKGLDLESLAKGLSNLGLAKEYEVEANLFIMTPMKKVFWKDWPEWGFRNIKTTVYSDGDDKEILDLAFKNVLKGKFEVESNTYLDQMFRSVPELVPVLSKENVIKAANYADKFPLNSIDDEKRGKIYSTQLVLVEEIEGLMIARMKDTGYHEDYVLRHLNENIGYNVKINKI